MKRIFSFFFVLASLQAFSQATVILPVQLDTSRGKGVATNWQRIRDSTVQAAATAAVSAGGLPTQTGNSGKFLGTNGTSASWVTGGSGSGTDSSDVAGYGILKSVSGTVRTYKVDTANVPTLGRLNRKVDSANTVFSTTDFYGQFTTGDPGKVKGKADSTTTKDTLTAHNSRILANTTAIAGKQATLTAGTGIAITGSTISATGGGYSGPTASYLNVVDFGAVGDSTTDCTTAFRAARNAAGIRGGNIIIPPGVYKLTDSVIVPKAIQWIGAGAGVWRNNYTYGSFIPTKIITTSATKDLFVVTTSNASFRGIGFENYAGSTPTSGSAIKIDDGGTSLGMICNISECEFRHFWINIDAVRWASSSIRNCNIGGAHKAAIHVQNVSTPDGGDCSIENCVFSDSGLPSVTGGSLAMIWQESGGGLRVENNKVVGTGGVWRYQYGYYGNFGTGVTADVNFTGNGFENTYNGSIKIVSNGYLYGRIPISGNHFAGESSNGSYADIDIDGVKGVAIGTNTFKGLSGQTAIKLSNVNHANTLGNTYDNYGSTNPRTYTSCTDVVDEASIAGSGGSGGGGGTTLPTPLASYVFNEGTGTTAVDAIGAKNLTLNNGATWGTGSVLLDGTDDYLNGSAINYGLNNGTEMSLSFYIKTSDVSGRILGKQIADGYNTFRVVISAANTIEFSPQNDSAVNGGAIGEYPGWAATLPNDGAFHLVTFTWKKNALNQTDGVVYIDHSAVSATFAANDYNSNFVLKETSNNMVIGRRPISFTDYFSGELKKLKIWNTKLSAAQEALIN